MAASNGVAAECIEHVRFPHCLDWVRFLPRPDIFVFVMMGLIYNPILYALTHYLFYIVCSVVSTVLDAVQIKGFDVKALRAFRVLRPLRLVSGVPSKYIGHIKYKICL